MRCFYHNSIEAVATCKNCSRGVCPECLTEFANGIACKNRCEAEVEALILLISRNKIAHRAVSSGHSRTAVFYFVASVLSYVLGVTFFVTEGSRFLALFGLFSGTLLLVGSIQEYLTSKRIKEGKPAERA